MKLKNRLQIHFLQFLSFVENLLARNYRQSFQLRLCAGTPVSFHISYLYVNAIVHHLVCFLQHPVGFSHTGYHANVYLEFTTARTTD